MKKLSGIQKEFQIFNKPFINKCNWKGINCPSKIDDQKRFEKNHRTIALNICMLKKKKYVQLMFESTTQPVKNK